jgi:stringent starvation protein B
MSALLFLSAKSILIAFLLKISTAMTETSTKPYFMRAIYEWCTDNGFTPYMAVKVFGAAKVPMEFVRGGEIVLNISFGATSGLKMDNEAVTFNARFGGVSREIYVPIANVQAVYASENGQGMAFELEMKASPVEEKNPEIIEQFRPGLGLAAVSTKTESGDKLSAAIFVDAPEKKFEKPTLKIIK